MWRALREWGDGLRWPRFALWALVGAYVCIVPLSLGSMIILAPVIVVVLAVAWPLLRPVSAGGAVAGVGLPLLLMAYLNREGPGFICTYGIDESSCSERVDPLPWLVVGSGLVLAGVAIEVWARHRTHSAARGLT